MVGNWKKPLDGAISNLFINRVRTLYPYQVKGLEIWEKLGKPENLKARIIKACKIYPEFKINLALSYSIDFPDEKNRWKLFFKRLSRNWR